MGGAVYFEYVAAAGGAPAASGNARGSRTFGQERRHRRERMVTLEKVQLLATRGLTTGWRQLVPYGETPEWSNEEYIVMPGYSTLTSLFLPVPFTRISRDLNQWYDDMEKVAGLPTLSAQR